MFSEQSIVRKSKTVYYEGIFIILIGFMIVGNTTITDIIFHDSYVLPQISACHESNQDQYCTEIRTRMGLSSTAHVEIGDIYWAELARQALFIGLIMFSIRIGLAWFLQKAGIRQIRTSTVLMALFWGMVGSSLFLFGFLDLFYYWFVLETPPTELAWLNNAGFFVEAKTWTGDPNLVEIEDLYLLNLLGLVLIGSFLFIIMKTYASSGLSPRGIA